MPQNFKPLTAKMNKNNFLVTATASPSISSTKCKNYILKKNLLQKISPENVFPTVLNSGPDLACGALSQPRASCQVAAACLQSVSVTSTA